MASYGALRCLALRGVAALFVKEALAFNNLQFLGPHLPLQLQSVALIFVTKTVITSLDMSQF